MVFAGFALADFGAIAVAMLWSLLCVGAYLLIRGIAAALPDFHVAFVHINFKGWFNSVADGISSWLVDQSKDAWHEATTLFHLVAYVFSNIMGEVVNVAAHLGDQVGHIVGTEIPNAIRAAEGHAGAHVAREIRHLQNEIKGAERDAGRALSRADRSIYTRIANVESTVKGDITAAVSHGVNAAEGYTDRQVDALRNYIDSQIGAAERVAAGATADVARQLGTAIAGAAQTAASQLADAERTLTGEIQTAESTAAGALRSAEGTLTGEIQSTAQTAAAGVASAEQAATTEVGTLGRELTGDISTAVGTLTGDIASEAQAAAGDLSSTRALLEAAISGAVAGVAAQVAHLAECAVTTCDGPNNLTNLLQDLFGIADFAAFAAFISAAIQHPAQTGQTFEQAAQGLYTDADDLLNTLLSI